MRLPIRYIYSAVLLLLCGLGAAKTTPAVVVDGRSSTQLLWFNDIVDGSKQIEATEYFRAAISGEKLSLKGYGKLNYNEKRDDELQYRLYYLYADYKGFMDSADIKLGRQFVNLSAGGVLMDGIEADVNRRGPVGFVVTGGRNVIFGENKDLASHVYSYGAQVYFAGTEMTYLDVSYYRAYDYSDIVRDIMGGSYKQYFFNLIKAYANARYDLTSQSFNDVLGGLKFFPTLNLMLTAEYYESYPTFDTTSIYSVFAVDQFKEGLFRVDYTLASWLDISVAYKHESFGEGGHAEVYEAGLRLRPSLNTTIGLFHDKREGYPGDLSGYKVYAEYGRLGKWKAAAGADHDVYERDKLTGRETARKYWVGGRYVFAKKISSSFRVEDNVNVNYTDDIQGRLTFDFDF